jgi:predicted DNA-binding transcriptional regulator AlpA
MDEHEYLTFDEVAKKARMSRRALYKKRASGKGPRCIDTGGRLLVSRADFAAWMESQREPEPVGGAK